MATIKELRKILDKLEQQAQSDNYMLNIIIDGEETTIHKNFSEGIDLGANNRIVIEIGQWNGADE